MQLQHSFDFTKAGDDQYLKHVCETANFVGGVIEKKTAFPRVYYDAVTLLMLFGGYKNLNDAYITWVRDFAANIPSDKYINRLHHPTRQVNMFMDWQVWMELVLPRITTGVAPYVYSSRLRNMAGKVTNYRRYSYANSRDRNEYLNSLRAIPVRRLNPIGDSKARVINALIKWSFYYKRDENCDGHDVTSVQAYADSWLHRVSNFPNLVQKLEIPEEMLSHSFKCQNGGVDWPLLYKALLNHFPETKYIDTGIYCYFSNLYLTPQAHKLLNETK